MEANNWIIIAMKDVFEYSKGLWIWINLTWGNLDCNTEYPYIDFCFTWNKNNYMETGKMTYAFDSVSINTQLLFSYVRVGHTKYLVFYSPLWYCHSIFCCVDIQYGFYNPLSPSIGHILLSKPHNKLVPINIHYMLGRM